MCVTSAERQTQLQDKHNKGRVSVGSGLRDSQLQGCYRTLRSEGQPLESRLLCHTCSPHGVCPQLVLGQHLAHTSESHRAHPQLYFSSDHK